MNPEQVKRREYLGLATLVLGAIGVIAGVVWFFFQIPTGLILLGIGVAAGTIGILVLNRIPDMIASGDDLW